LGQTLPGDLQAPMLVRTTDRRCFILALRLKPEKRLHHVEQHAGGVGLDRRIERSAAVIPVEEVGNRDVQGLCYDGKLACRHLVDTALVLLHLLSADTELPGQLLSGQDRQQAELLEPVSEKSIKLRTLVPAHGWQSFVVSGL
jgi:hypothetical protein